MGSMRIAMAIGILSGCLHGKQESGIYRESGATTATRRSMVSWISCFMFRVHGHVVNRCSHLVHFSLLLKKKHPFRQEC